MFFTSLERLSDLTLNPRVPSNYFTENGYEDDVTPRVCVSETLEGSITALSRNLKGKLLHVYYTENNECINPGTSRVPDRDITKEMWFLDPVSFRYIGTIRVKDTESSFEFSYGDNLRAILYSWNFCWGR